MPSIAIDLWLQEELERFGCEYVRKLVKARNPDVGDHYVSVTFERCSYGDCNFSWSYGHYPTERTGEEDIPLRDLLRAYLAQETPE